MPNSEKAAQSPEFIWMMALLFATFAFAIDSLLPAIPGIAAQLTPEDANRSQLVITGYMFGMGVGTLLVGPLSDWLGRKPVILSGLALYAMAALLAARSFDIESLLIARFLMGFGAAAPRVLTIAMIRDLYEGREMARMLSLIMAIYVVIPAVAPACGAAIMSFIGWRGLCSVYALFAVVVGAWLVIRQPETLPMARRRPLRLESVRYALREILGQRVVVIYILVLSFVFGQMYVLLSSSPQVFDQSYDRGATFPYWFALVVGSAAVASLINTRLLLIVGIHKLATWALVAQFGVTMTALSVMWAGKAAEIVEFYIFLAYLCASFFSIGLTFSNINALAMSSLGHVPGYAATVIGAISTLVAVLIAVPVANAFNGTPLPLLVGLAIFSAMAVLLMYFSCS